MAGYFDPLSQYGYQSPTSYLMPGNPGSVSNAPLAGSVFQQNPLASATTSMNPNGYLSPGGGIPGAAGQESSFLGGAFGKDGWGGPALGALSGLLQGFMSMQNYGLAKDQLALQREAYETNTANQKKLVNSQLEDRQRARVASNPGAYQSVDDYLKKNGV